MTARGRLALAFAVLAYAAAWAFGSKPLYPVAVGLALAVGLSWAWVHLAHRPLRLHRDTRRGEHYEGDDVDVKLELEQERRLTPASVVLHERIGRLGASAMPLARRGGVLSGRYSLRRLPRGRYAFADTYAVLEDPFGLHRVEVDVPAGGALVVYPRLVEVERLFSEGGAGVQDGRRLLLRRPSGFDLHSVREYEEGESLRKVHWPTTARRGELMVKELEDSPRDEVAVLLDAHQGAVAGTPPESSFDMQVRAAGSILHAHARRGRRAVLVVNSRGLESTRVHSLDGDWRQALELLAGAAATGERPAAAILADDGGPLGVAHELAVVTAVLTPSLVDRLLQRALARRSVSLVYVDAASFVPTTQNGRDPSLLRLQAAGIPVAVLRRGDDLAARLEGFGAAKVAAHG